MFLFLLPPAFLSPSLVVCQPSICHPWPVSAPPKDSDFKMEHFSSASLAAPACCFEFVSCGKKRHLYIREERYINERKMHYAQKCGRSIYCAHLYLAWYSKPLSVVFNDMVITAILFVSLTSSIFHRALNCPPLFLK